MNQPAILDDLDVHALQQWLREAWKQLGDPSLTAFSRRELRNQMKLWSADLRTNLKKLGDRPQTVKERSPPVPKPELRLLAGDGKFAAPKNAEPSPRVRTEPQARSVDNPPAPLGLAGQTFTVCYRHIGLTNDGNSTCVSPWSVPAILA